MPDTIAQVANACEVTKKTIRSLFGASVFSGSRINGLRIGGSRDMHAQLDFEHWEIFIP